MSLYTLSNIKKLFEHRLVVDIPSFTFDEGCIYALLGANGAGKTTLLNMLAFLHKPSSGTLFYKSQKVQFSEKELQKFRQEVVLVDQKPILFSTTVYKNMEFGLKIRKVPGVQRAKLIEDALDLVGMKKFQGEMAANLSGGETQRIALARALVLNPQVLLCDEPTASVDSANQQLIIKVLKKINKQKKITIIFTTHDNSLASKLAQKTIHLSFGHLDKHLDDNIFCSSVTRSDDDTFYCTLPGGGDLRLGSPSKVFDPKKTCTFTIDPWMIQLEQGNENLHEVNRIKAVIVSIESVQTGVRVTLDSSILVRSMLHEKVYAKEKYFVGQEVFFSVHPRDIKIHSVDE